MGMKELELGQTVTFKKYGAKQEGVVVAKRTTETVETTVYAETENALGPKRETRRVRYLVSYTLKNGNEVRGWMKDVELDQT